MATKNLAAIVAGGVSQDENEKRAIYKKLAKEDSPAEPGDGENSIVQKGSNAVAFGENSVALGTSSTNAKDRGITEESTNDEIIEEWENSDPESDKFALVKGEGALVEGNNNLALGKNSHAEGNGTIAANNSSHSEGTGTKAIGKYAHAEGLETLASGKQSHSEGSKTIASASSSHAEGESTIANQAAAHAEGINTVAGTGTRPTVETDTTAGKYSHAEGNGTQASGNSSHAEGKGTEASGTYSHSEGLNTIASGPSAHAEGESNEAAEDCSHAEGYNNKVYSGAGSSHVEGSGAEVRNSREHAQGSYNVSHTLQNHGFNGSSEKTLHSVGIGTSDNNRKNAFEIMQNGDAYLLGVGGYDGTNPAAATSLQDTLEEIANYEEIPWANLKSKRDSSELAPGKWYRIIDYATTVNPEMIHISVANHQFDILVLATDVNKLSEEARAVAHVGDTYFTNNKANLNAWKVWYCLDNNTEKYYWAAHHITSYDGSDTTSYIRYKSIDQKVGNIQYYGWWSWGTVKPYYTRNEIPEFDDDIYDDTFTSIGNVYTISIGKGVIYRMIDEWNNDCPYDFKNILFKVYKITSCNDNNLEENYTMRESSSYYEVSSEQYWSYTFCVIDTENNNAPHDVSVEQYVFMNDENAYEKTCGNIVKERVDLFYYSNYGTYPQLLPMNCFVTNTDLISVDGFFPYVNNYIGRNCYCNVFGLGSDDNTLVSGYGNTLSSFCSHILMMSGCSNNVIIYGVSISLGVSCSENVFAFTCGNIKCGRGCNNNIFAQNTTNVHLLDGITNLDEDIPDSKQYTQFVGLNSSGAVQIWNPADATT